MAIQVSPRWGLDFTLPEKFRRAEHLEYKFYWQDICV